MGVLDVPAPIFAWIDRLGGGLPTSARLVLWGAACGVVTMLLYAILSPQKRVAEAKRDLVEARRALDRYDGEFAGARPLLGAVFRKSLRPFTLSFVPAVVSGLPVILVAAWLSTSYGHEYPKEDESVAVRVAPARFSGRWLGGGRPGVVVLDERGQAVEDLSFAAPVPIVEKPRWWNALIGNPAGYLPRGHPIEAVEVDMPRQRHVGFGPSWMRGWEALFFLSVAATAVLVKVAFRIE